MSGSPKYKLYHGSTYIGSFKYSDDAETYCEAMQAQGKIIGELTIRDGHTKSSIELTYSQAPKGPELDEPIKYINIEIKNGLIESANMEGVEYAVSINDTSDEPDDKDDEDDLGYLTLTIEPGDMSLLELVFSGYLEDCISGADEDRKRVDGLYERLTMGATPS